MDRQPHEISYRCDAGIARMDKLSGVKQHRQEDISSRGVDLPLV
uniref:Uncharacterized protein n=1 Tax=Arundo donax TaxID=35708 RepID=A0A0A9E6Z2_ARUDO